MGFVFIKILSCPITFIVFYSCKHRTNTEQHGYKIPQGNWGRQYDTFQSTQHGS